MTDGAASGCAMGWCSRSPGHRMWGKSLVNALAERDVAIVSPVARHHARRWRRELVLAGVPVTLVDTAGLRDTDSWNSGKAAAGVILMSLPRYSRPSARSAGGRPGFKTSGFNYPGQ